MLRTIRSVLGGVGQCAAPSAHACVRAGCPMPSDWPTVSIAWHHGVTPSPSLTAPAAIRHNHSGDTCMGSHPADSPGPGAPPRSYSSTWCR
eukprot:CAMPEP_0181200296 /NCGR_PEP_ID=MMETSP1096-20121128/17681_1 /TAXON_ID=156174 ORGANISM="Chrysochromulina ericina, Strain CCMP281" /NCGR_SAMPLE_ID=MMETSP1096 /ASSEMBLY_ACC=CAM_ASM_000453 /LENGTH=90 /DNA_ID=CAMNT_0023290629 /DNA_START=214 /DNA_END=486 /DNA_ORIENTATION=-